MCRWIYEASWIVRLLAINDREKSSEAYLLQRVLELGAALATNGAYRAGSPAAPLASDRSAKWSFAGR
jgi:hypothetical protein